MRFHLTSPDLLEVSSKGKSQYRTQANLKNGGRLNLVAKLSGGAIAPTAAGSHEGGSRSATLAVPHSLALVRYPFTMRVRSV